VTSKFGVTVQVIDREPGKWQTARAEIFERDGETTRKIGHYDRNHAGWVETTFAPFEQDGRWYALYAPDYTATRVMELPSCKDLGGEEPHTNGFCPVDYYIPYEHAAVMKAGDAGRFGFVAGCIWGDDSSWKIQYLDLSEVSRGVVVRREAFGYIPMPHRVARLADCISLDGYSKEYPRAEIAVGVTYDLQRGTMIDPLE
jgi:hypothetical protein